MLQQVKKQESFISSYVFPSFNNKAPKITWLEQHFYLINHSQNLTYKDSSISPLSSFILAIFSVFFKCVLSA